MSVSYEDNNNKEFINSLPVEGRRKPTATVVDLMMDRLPAGPFSEACLIDTFESCPIMNFNIYRWVLCWFYLQHNSD